MSDRPVPDDATVHEDILGAADRPLIAEGGSVAVNLQPRSFLADLDQIEPFAKELEETLAGAVGGRALDQLSPRLP